MLNHVLKGFNLTSSKNICHELCSACQMGKTHRLSLQNVHTRSKQPFDILHVDVWDPSPIAGTNGMRYFLFFVDDYSRYQWLYVMYSKAQVNHVF